MHTHKSLATTWKKFCRRAQMLFSSLFLPLKDSASAEERDSASERKGEGRRKRKSGLANRKLFM